jgi:signal transduction histidine kinase
MSSARNDPPGARAWRSLGARFALWYLLVTLLSFAAVAVVFAVHTNAWVEREGQRSASSLLDTYRRALDAGGTDAVRAMLAAGAGGGQSIAVRLTDERDVELLAVSSDPEADQATLRLHHEGGSSSSAGAAAASGTAASGTWRVAGARIAHGRTLEVVVRDDAAPRLWANAREELGLVLACWLLTAIAGAFVISRRALRPVGELARTMQQIIDSGDLGLRVPERGSGDELERLAALFNRMLARNEALVRAMKQSLDDVAHDLRTPLARLRAGAELALHEPVDPERAQEALADVIEESERVLGMLTTLMDITEAETGSMRLERRPEDLATVVREAVELYDLVSNERGVHVVTRLAPGITVMVDRRRILQAVANLLDNAIKYTPGGGTVDVSVTGDERWGIVEISDTGMGIALEDQPRVWDRLFRADQSRTERGLGLGLSLVKAVVEAHGGEVELHSEPGTGATFVVRLPRAY